jgi:hypothetical protein
VRQPLKTSIIKWSELTNCFALYDYDPVDTLGDILPYHLRNLDDKLRMTKSYDIQRHINSWSKCMGWSMFIMVIIGIAALVVGIILLARTIGVWTIPAAFGILFVIVILIVFINMGMGKSRDAHLDKLLINRTKEFNSVLNEYVNQDPTLKDLSHVNYEIGEFGSFIKLDYGNEYVLRAERKKPHNFANINDLDIGVVGQ